MSCEACNTNAEKLPRAAAVVEAARSLERNARGMAMYVRESGGNTNASVLEHWCEAVREALAAYEKGDGGDA